jgi:HK97 family phage prohead protease
MSRPIDNLVRAWAAPEATELRAGSDGEGSTMFGHFAVFDRWTEISSFFEGNFLERIAPGAFADTFRAKAGQIRVLYDHGADPQIGNKPLGTPDVLREDKKGAYYEVGLFDSSYVNDLKPAIRANQLGASFRFKVTAEEWVTPSEASSDNPQKLDERTITGVDLYEFGPVTFPAYEAASAGLRSRTDEFIEHFLNDPAFVARFTERAGLATTERILATLPPTAPVTTPPPAPIEGRANPDESADGDEDEALQRRKAYFARSTAGFVDHLSRL